MERIDWRGFDLRTQVFRPESASARFVDRDGTVRIVTVDGSARTEWMWNPNDLGGCPAIIYVPVETRE